MNTKWVSGVGAFGLTGLETIDLKCQTMPSQSKLFWRYLLKLKSLQIKGASPVNLFQRGKFVKCKHTIKEINIPCTNIFQEKRKKKKLGTS